MRKRTRLAATAGVTVLGFAAMSGMSGAAQADTGGLDLDLSAPLAKAGPLGKTVDSVLKPVTSAVKVKVPVKARVSVPTGGSGAPAVKAHVKVGVKAPAVRAGADVRLCVGPPQQCGRQPVPPSPIPPAPPTPPPAPPVVNPIPPAPPSSTGNTPSTASLTVIGNSLPFTGGPIGALAFLGALAVVTGAAGVAGSRLKAGRTA